MTKQQAREAAAVMLAWADGKEVQKKMHGTIQWLETEPLWDWIHYTYRLKPTATLRPWTADEVPLGAWIRFKNMNVTRSIIVSVQRIDLGIMFQDYEHSTDGGKTWKECGVHE